MTKKYVKLSPITRLEGHLGITARTKDGANGWPWAQGYGYWIANLGVTDYVHTAYSHGEMFRGLEKILVGGAKDEGHGRDPRDAPVITSRTCGVCHFIHRHVSLRNIENAAGWDFPAPQAKDAYTSGIRWASGEQPGQNSAIERWFDHERNMRALGAGGANPLPPGAQIARNIVHLVTYVYSHAAHTIALAAPDYKAVINWYVESIYAGAGPGYVDPTSESAGSGTFFDNFLQEAVVAQRILHEILGFLGGKVPHQQSAIPGGFSRSFTGPIGSTPGSDIDWIAALATKTVALGGADPTTVTSSQRWPLLDLSAGLDAGLTLTGTTAATDWITQRVVPFTFGLAVAAAEVAAPLFGVGSNNFVCAPTFDIVRLTDGAGNTPKSYGDAYFRGGVMINSLGAATRYGLDPGIEDSRDIDGGDAADWMTIYEDITSGKYPYQDDYTGQPVCGGYRDDWLDTDTGAQAPLVKPGYPGETETHPAVDYECPEERYMYTWYKATRVKDSNDNLYTVESGPLARLVINGLDPHLNLNGFTLPGTSPALVFTNRGLRTDVYEWAATGATGVTDTMYEWMSSTWNRLIARLQDALLMIDMLIGSNYSGENSSTGYLKEIYDNGCWLTELMRVWVQPYTYYTGLGWSPANSSLNDNALLGTGLANGTAIPPSVVLGGNTVYILVQDTPPSGPWENLNGKKGAAIWDAPRGITCHFCQITDGRLSQYQHIAGTTWNGNGRDSQGNPGPFEWSLMNYRTSGRGAGISAGSTPGGGKYIWNDSGPTELTMLPIVERSVRIIYKLYEGQSWKWYTAYDVPRHDSTVRGEIKGHGIESSSYIDYETGKIEVQFTYNYDFPDYSHVDSVSVDYYGAAGPFAVPTPVKGQQLTGIVTGNPYNAWDSPEMGYGSNTDINNGYPNPINILRTIRSYDPCLACSVHVLDKESRKTGKFEVLPVAGWDPEC